jgi:hypothetical protein
MIGCCKEWNGKKLEFRLSHAMYACYPFVRHVVS